MSIHTGTDALMLQLAVLTVDIRYCRLITTGAYPVVLQLAVLIVDDPGAHMVQEATVVRHHHAGHVRQVGQVVLQPRHILDVQVVGGLIQQHDVSLHQHGTGCTTPGNRIRIAALHIQVDGHMARATANRETKLGLLTAITGGQSMPLPRSRNGWTDTWHVKL